MAYYFKFNVVFPFHLRSSVKPIQLFFYFRYIFSVLQFPSCFIAYVSLVIIPICFVHHQHILLFAITQSYNSFNYPFKKARLGQTAHG